MKKSYLFYYSDTVGTLEEVRDHVDSMSSVLLWRYDTNNLFYIVSEKSAHEIAKEFEGKAGSQGRFIISEYNGNAEGRLTHASWHLLIEKEYLKDEK